MSKIDRKKEIDTTIKNSIGKLCNDKQIHFLKEIILTGGSIRKAAERSGISTSSHYDWLSKQDNYREAFEDAYEKSTQILEAEAIRRATGYEKPLIYKGVITGYVQEYSDNLLMFLLKKRDPSYKDNYTQQVGIWGTGKDRVNVVFNIPQPKNDNTETQSEESEQT